MEGSVRGSTPRDPERQRRTTQLPARLFEQLMALRMSPTVSVAEARSTTQLAARLFDQLMAMTHEDVREIEELVEERSTESVAELVARNEALAGSVAEARRNAEAFTYARFRMASGGGEPSVLDHRSLSIRPSATTNVSNPPLPNRRTDEALSDSEEEDGDDSSSQDTEPGPEQGEEEEARARERAPLTPAELARFQMVMEQEQQEMDEEQAAPDDHEWYYRRRREMEEQDAARGLPIEIYRRPLPVPEIGMLREQMDQLEEDMENAKIDEGTYVERADELRDAYLHARHLPWRLESHNGGVLYYERHHIVTNIGPLGLRADERDETDSMGFNGNRPALPDRSWAHIVHSPTPLDEEIPEVD